MGEMLGQVAAVFCAIAGIMVSLMGFRKPEMSLFYAVFMIPFQIELPFISVLKVNEYAIILWLLVFIIHLIHKGSIKRTPIGLSVVGVLFVLLFRTIIDFWIYNNPNEIMEYVRLFVALIFPISAYMYFDIDWDRMVDRLLSIWETASATLVLVSLLCSFLNGYSVIDYILAYIKPKTLSFYTMKFASTPFFGDPNSYAGYIAISIGIAVYLWKKEKRKKHIIVIGVLTIGIITALSRGALLSAAVALLIIGIVFRKTRALCLLAVVGGSFVAIPFLIAYIQNDWSAMSRFGLWGTAISMFSDSPIIGVGLNNFSYLFENYRMNMVTDNPYTHNLYLKVLVETGLVGELLFLGINVRTLKRCLKFERFDSKSYVFIFGICSFLAQGMTVEFFTSNYYWFFLLLTYSYYECNDAV